MASAGPTLALTTAVSLLAGVVVWRQSARPEPPQRVVLEGADVEGRWMALCLPRSAAMDAGPEPDLEEHARGMEPWLLLADGHRERVDEYVDSSASGRFAAYIRGGALRLLDAATGQEVDLPGAETEDRSQLHHHRAAAFAGEAEVMAFLRARRGRVLAVVRNLATGVEREIDVGPGLLDHLELDASGTLLTAYVITQDSNQDGSLTWPEDGVWNARRCSGGARSWETRCVHHRSGDRPFDDETETRHIELASGRITVQGRSEIDQDGVALEMASQDLLKALHGPKQWRFDDGFRLPVPEGCARWPYFVNLGRHELLISCGPQEGSHLYWYTPAGLSTAGVGTDGVSTARVAERRHFEPIPQSKRLVAVQTPPAVLDAADHSIHPLLTGDWVVALGERYALLLRGQALVIYDVMREREVLTVARDVAWAEDERVLQRDGLVLVQGIVVDLRSGAYLGHHRSQVLALGRGGRALVLEPGAREPRWVAPEF